MTELAVCHHIPGRIRLRLAFLQQLPEAGNWLKTCLFGIRGIKHVRVNHHSASVVVGYDATVISHDEIQQRIISLDHADAEQSDIEHEFTRGEVALNVIGTLFAAFLPGKLGLIPTLPLIAPTLLEGAETLKDRKMKVEVLDAIAVGLSAWRGDYKTAMLTQSLISMGEFMEQQTSKNSEQLLAELMRRDAVDIWVERDGQKTKISSEELENDDILVLGPGDAIPADGHIASGTGLINQASLTGESVPVRRETGAYVYAGTLVQEGNIRVKAEKVGSESTTSRITRFIADSLAEKSETQQVTQQMADRRVKITLGAGAAVFALTRDFERLASVFLVDYSCALKLSTPVAFKSVMYKAARHGILLKGGRAIEQIAQVDTCVFDKTGTLTFGDMEVTDVLCLRSQNDARELLAIAASVEEHCNHPLSQAIVNAAKDHELPHIEHGEVEYIIAHGLRSTLNDKVLNIGSRHYLETHEGVDFSPFENEIAELEVTGRHMLFVATSQKLIGVIGLKDHLRPEAAEVLAELKSLGVRQLVLLTGDKKEKAHELARTLGIDIVYAEASPEDKAGIIESLKEQGHKVMFVGDGVNDAPALTIADVGVSMSQGTELAQHSADVVLLRDELCGIAESRWLATDAMALVSSNIRIAEVVNSGIMLAAALGRINPAASALLHNGTTLAVLLRSLAAKND